MKSTSPAKAGAPLDQVALVAAVRLFVDRFVVDDKRAQLGNRLATAARRGDSLATLARWLAGAPAPLVGVEQSRAGLEARVGPMLGIYLDPANARRMSIGEALELGRGQPSLFVADTGRLALVMRSDGPPLLTIRL